MEIQKFKSGIESKMVHKVTFLHDKEVERASYEILNQQELLAILEEVKQYNNNPINLETGYRQQIL